MEANIVKNVTLPPLSDAAIIVIMFSILIIACGTFMFKYYKNESKLYKINQEQEKRIIELERNLAATSASYRNITETLDIQIQRNNILSDYINSIVEHAIKHSLMSKDLGEKKNVDKL